MKNISKMVAQMTLQKVVHMGASNPPKPISKPKFVSAETAVIVNNLFVELQAIFPAWRYSFPSDEALNNAKKSWIKTFMEAGINSESQLQFGLKKARASLDGYWPKASIFMGWCKPSAEDFDLPCKEDAYREVIANLGELNIAKWSHQAVYEAAKNAGTYALKNRSEQYSRTLFYHSYANMVERVVGGEILQVDTPKAITTVPEYRPASQAVEQSYLSGMKKKVGLV